VSIKSGKLGKRKSGKSGNREIGKPETGEEEMGRAGKEEVGERRKKKLETRECGKLQSRTSRLPRLKDWRLLYDYFPLLRFPLSRFSAFPLFQFHFPIFLLRFS